MNICRWQSGCHCCSPRQETLHTFLLLFCCLASISLSRRHQRAERSNDMETSRSLPLWAGARALCQGLSVKVDTATRLASSSTPPSLLLPATWRCSRWVGRERPKPTGAQAITDVPSSIGTWDLWKWLLCMTHNQLGYNCCELFFFLSRPSNEALCPCQGM